MDTNCKDWIIIVAAGSGSRFGRDKMFFELEGAPLIKMTVNTALCVCPNVILVTNDLTRHKYLALFGDSVLYAEGGQTRTQSVQNGLKLLPADTRLVAIHDGARPFASADLFKKMFAQAAEKGNAVPCFPLPDTAYAITDEILPICRSSIVLAQTPQVFDASKLIAAYNAHKMATTDDGQIWLQCYGNINLVEGESNNRKITYLSDLVQYKTGIGFDAHQLAEGRKLILCGENISFPLGLVGHSDADVAAHALMDAILSAIGQRDIGVLFPDDDPTYKDADSFVLLKTVLGLMEEAGYALVNISLVIMAQSPKLQPYIENMKKNICAATKLSLAQTNISATTTENLGITAEGKGIACQAVVLLKK